MTKPHPNQPTFVDKHGTRRFQQNAIVHFLLDAGPFDLSQLRRMAFDQNDWEQFAQLIEYSVGGYADLSFVSEARYQSIPDEVDAPEKTYQEGFADGLAHAVELLQGHIRGDYDG